MLSKSLIQLSADGQGCVSSLLFDLRPNYGGGNDGNGHLLQKAPQRHCCTQCPTLQQPPSHTPLPQTPGHSRASLGQCLVGSLLLSPRSWCTRFCRALREAVSQSCISYGGSTVGSLATSSKRAYATPRSAAPRASVSAEVHCWPVPARETLRCSSVSVSVGSLGPGAHNLCLSPLSVSGRYGV